MNRFRNIMVVLFMAICLLPSQVRAQWNFDIFTVEAMIDDHKDIRSRLLARSTMEQANLLLHEASKASTQEYDSVAINLDKYQKCFTVNITYAWAVRKFLIFCDLFQDSRKPVSAAVPFITV